MLGSQKMITDNRMLQRKRFHSHSVLGNAKFTRFPYHQAFNVIAWVVNLLEDSRSPWLFFILCDCSVECIS